MRTSPPLTTRTAVVLAVLSLAVAALVGLATASPAEAAPRVSVANAQGSAAIDPRYATTLTLSGSGFQSIRNGHGGIYVFFGTVSGSWKPSQGGQTGRDLLYVPDSETRDNRGYQRFVAFPGSDTAAAANGGSLAANGRWSTQIVVPGAVFKARDRANKVRTVDCRAVRCGIITIGAHGVKNARNETFTPVRVEDLTSTGAAAQPSSGTPAAPEGTGAEAQAPEQAADDEEAPKRAAPALVVDRDTAVAGRVMSFSATGLQPGEQVTATLDDGVAAVGPLSAGSDGQLAGALELPADLGVGTHQLRLSGGSSAPAVSFPVSVPTVPVAATSAPTPWPAMAAAAVALLVLLAAVTFAAVRTRSTRRNGTRHDTALA